MRNRGAGSTLASELQFLAARTEVPASDRLSSFCSRPCDMGLWKGDKSQRLCGFPGLCSMQVRQDETACENSLRFLTFPMCLLGQSSLLGRHAHARRGGEKGASVLQASEAMRVEIKRQGKGRTAGVSNEASKTKAKAKGTKLATSKIQADTQRSSIGSWTLCGFGRRLLAATELVEETAVAGEAGAFGCW